MLEEGHGTKALERFPVAASICRVGIAHRPMPGGSRHFPETSGSLEVTFLNSCRWAVPTLQNKTGRHAKVIRSRPKEKLVSEAGGPCPPYRFNDLI